MTAKVAKGSFTGMNELTISKQEFYPDSITTDRHVLSINGLLIDMQTTMSKFLSMRMLPEEVILRSTHTPAKIINR